EIARGLGVIGAQLERRVVHTDRGGDIGTEVDVAEVVERVEIRRVELERPHNEVDGARWATPLVGQEAEIVQRVDVIGLRLEHREVDLLRLVKVSGAVRGNRRQDAVLQSDRLAGRRGQAALDRRASTTRPST